MQKSVQILERTPGVLTALLRDLDAGWTHSNEGRESWSPYDIVGHLVYGEKKNWIPRLHLIIGSAEDKQFEPFNRVAQFEESQGKSLVQLLDEFENLRASNLAELRALNLSEEQLDKKGIHPAFGEVTLRAMLATWVAHDLAHLHQMTRVMAKQYREAVGPWVGYLGVMK